MKKIIITLSILILNLTVFGQKTLTPTQKAQPIVEEGKALYKCEMASWYGTDLFLAKYENKDDIGGYFSYSEEQETKCIFFSRGTAPKVIGTITFEPTFSVEKANVNLKERAFTEKEQDLYEIRSNGAAIIQSDDLFKFYENTNLNLIPLIHRGERKMYVLTGPSVGGVVIFGNDYLLTFDENNQVITKKALHQNIIPYEYDGKHEEGKEVVGGIHTHLPETGDFITATDICTLMLYSKYTTWKSYTVLSEKYMNNWDCETNTLMVIPRKTLEKIEKDQKKRKKKREKKDKKKKKG